MGAVIHPNLASSSKGLLAAAPFVGAYLALVGVAIVGMVILACMDFPETAKRAASSSGRPLSLIARQSAFLVATGAAALSYRIMNLLMAATPLAMQHHGMPFADTASVFEWLVIGMFAPAFLPAI